MDASKIIRLVAVLVAIVAAFVAIPEEAAIIAVLGLVAGYFIEEERATAFLVMALALYMVSGALGPIWVIGEYLTAILASLSSLVNAAACTVIGVGIYNRLKP
ncbi:MAG: hypothetical protein E2O63_06040 [Gammaproteobacteria bacterium]|nr:MAG: hypothetical protein E2O63_06040 [Gammaproteobacteria bacterium]